MSHLKLCRRIMKSGLFKVEQLKDYCAYKVCIFFSSHHWKDRSKQKVWAFFFKDLKRSWTFSLTVSDFYVNKEDRTFKQVWIKTNISHCFALLCRTEAVRCFFCFFVTRKRRQFCIVRWTVNRKKLKKKKLLSPFLFVSWSCLGEREGRCVEGEEEEEVGGVRLEFHTRGELLAKELFYTVLL